MPYRKVPLVEGEVYHIFTKSIADFKIFNTDKDFKRMLETVAFYVEKGLSCKFSLFAKRQTQPNFKPVLQRHKTDVKKIVRILAYCIMPTHIHLILEQLEENGISRFINLVLKSYSKYFNLKHRRKGPLWEGRFKNVLVESDEQLLHLTRYTHLNPVTAFLVNDPQDWLFSSYREYIGLCEKEKSICDFSDRLNVDKSSYKEFVNDQIGYQRALAKIKDLAIEP